MKTLFLFTLVYSFLAITLDAQYSGHKTADGDHYHFIDVNNCTMWIGNHGSSSHDPRNDGSGFYWSKSSDDHLTSIFQDGLIWAGKMNNQIYAGGNHRRAGLQGGRILNDRTADNLFNENNRIYKIWKYWNTLPPGPKRDAFEKDYLEWPVEDGAPWVDVDNNGLYTVGVDQPKFEGDMTLWYVSNDLESNRTTFVFGSLPIGLEIQTSIYAFNTHNFLDDIVFKKYKIINKGKNDIKDFVLGYWSDSELGYGNDDFIGCDTLLNTAYCYNGDNNDEDNYGTAPPAVGYKFLPNSIGKMQMTAFWGRFHTPNHPSISPEIFYNFMNGLMWDGSPIYNPLTLEKTKYVVPGDPVDRVGWIEGAGWLNEPQPGDRQMLMSHGSYYFKIGDTLEVNLAIIMARGSSNINSVKKLKDKAKLLNILFGIDTPTEIQQTDEIIPNKFQLKQNYPNPFNPETVIEYTIGADVKGETSNVVLKIYDLLGRKIATLVNKEQSAGNYEVQFDASGLASGVYLYTLKAGPNFESKKMVFLE